MKLNPKLTGGLAWAGLIVVLAVPGADMLTKPQAGTTGVTTPQVDQIRTATIGQSAVAGEAGKDPVDAYVSSGKKLPSYISDAPADVASTKPAPTTKLVVPTTPTTATKPPVAVASLPSATPAVAPQPYPASLRPRPEPVLTATVPTVPAAEDAPLIIDENLVARREEAVARVLDEDEVAPSRPQPNRVVSGDELEEWDSGSLADYLERRNLISEGDAQASNSNFEDEEFFIEDGPNRSNARVVRRLSRDDDFFLF